MKPYYERDGITLYQGDCRDVLPTLGQVDLVLTDPPYGIGWKRGVNHARLSPANAGIANDEDTSARDWILEHATVPAVVFGSFYAPFPSRVRQVLVWQKPPDAGLVGSVTGCRRDAEPIFLVGDWPVRTVERSSVFRSRGGQAATCAETGHPHTKPLPLMLELVSLFTDPGETILDPFAGSGTTLVAAYQLGRKAIGVELEEKWCEVTARRLEACTPPLFTVPAEKPQQLTWEGPAGAEWMHTVGAGPLDVAE